MNRNVCAVYLGCIDYERGLAYQDAARQLVQDGHWDGIVLMLQHDPVITIGMHGGDTHLLTPAEWLSDHGVPVIHTNRGGDITCHNPGQLVCYPILNLKKWKPDVHWYVRTVEDWMIRSLKRVGIRAGRKAVYTGVWAGNQKIAAVGVGVRRWITFHGTALNVCNDLSLFSRIVPCGITEFGVTSIEQQGVHTSADAMVPIVSEEFTAAFPATTYTFTTNWGDLYERTNSQKASLA